MIRDRQPTLARDQAWKSEKADKERDMGLPQEDRRGFKDGGGGGGGDGDGEDGERTQPSTVPAQGKEERSLV